MHFIQIEIYLNIENNVYGKLSIHTTQKHHCTQVFLMTLVSRLCKYINIT